MSSIARSAICTPDQLWCWARWESQLIKATSHAMWYGATASKSIRFSGCTTHRHSEALVTCKTDRVAKQLYIGTATA